MRLYFEINYSINSHLKIVQAVKLIRVFRDCVTRDSLGFLCISIFHGTSRDVLLIAGNTFRSDWPLILQLETVADPAAG